MLVILPTLFNSVIRSVRRILCVNRDMNVFASAEQEHLCSSAFARTQINVSVPMSICACTCSRLILAFSLTTSSLHSVHSAVCFVHNTMKLIPLGLTKTN